MSSDSLLKCPMSGGRGGELVPLETPPHSKQQLPDMVSAVRPKGGRAGEVTWWCRVGWGVAGRHLNRIGSEEDPAWPGCAQPEPPGEVMPLRQGGAALDLLLVQVGPSEHPVEAPWSLQGSGGSSSPITPPSVFRETEDQARGLT